ncbi:MAG TPA: LuxR C-terminal-related transcriptional regulator [Candidatus Dormibacteraeota bacterium]|nr:LuxR C-terminal-related transcriptional regulator [Candidatus Dormibacteraeota bacterium]
MTSSPAAVTNLPVPLTRFVGREAELARASALLAEARLLTLTGPGGTGKTRLALRLASSVAEGFADGVWFVDFSTLSGGEFLWDTVAVTLGVKDPGSSTTLAESVGRYLAKRQALLVLDNCEHLVESAAEVAAGLMSAAPALKIVATSREPLAVAGEMIWAVPPLGEPDAIELFTDRARHVRPEFQLRPEGAEAVRSICRRLDGLPLAIELAAARVRALDPAYIAEGLKDHLALLPSGPRTAPQRQSTLAASFDWSHELLFDAERALLRQLSVFSGGFDVEAALAVCPAASLELLAALTDRSLIMLEHRSDQAEPRYRMLETVREFAAEYLEEANEVELIRTRHRDHYLRLAETAEANPPGLDFDYWVGRLFAEHDNLRAALHWSRCRADAQELARLTVALVPFWLARGRYAESEMWLGAASDRGADLSPLMQARIRNFHCFFALNATRLEELPELAYEALAMARTAGDKDEEAFALCTVGLVAGLVGGAEAMRPYLEEARALAPPAQVAVGVRLLCMGFLSQMSFILLRWFQSDPGEPRRLAEEAIDRGRAGRLSPLVFTGMWLAGSTALIQGQLADASRLLKTALSDGLQSDESLMWKCSLGLAWLSMYRGEFAAARTALDEGLKAAQSREFTGGSERVVGPVSRWILGWMDLADGRPAQARDGVTPLTGFIRATPLYGWAGLPMLVLAEAQLALGELDEAAATLYEATSLARSGALTWVLGRVALVRAKLHARKDDLQQAESLAHEAFGLAREAGDQLGLVDALELLARLAAAQDSLKDAVRLWGAAESRRAGLGYRFTTDRAANEAAIARARRAVGRDEFARAWAEGAKLSMEEAIAYAARGRGERRRPTAGWASLTPTEVEVVRLVGQHLSNPEIAARMFVSRATVKTHLVHIFAKLGINTRSELASEAIRRGV